MHSLVDWGWVDDKITAGGKEEERGFSFFLCFCRAGGGGCGSRGVGGGLVGGWVGRGGRGGGGSFFVCFVLR